MQNIEEICQKYFLDCKRIISELLYVEDVNRLVGEKNKVEELVEKISFLKILNENPSFFSLDIKEEPEKLVIENEVEHEEINPTDEELSSEIEENVANEYEKEEEIIMEQNVVEEPINEEETEIVVELEVEEEETITEIELTSETGEESDFTAEEAEDILEFENETLPQTDDEEITPTEKNDATEEPTNESEEEGEKKIKLASIKGLRNIQSLFDEDFLVEEKREEKTSEAINIPTNNAETEKAKQEFKLDLNDKIAFSKILFGGSQTELNETVHLLNQFKTLDEAKEYLSDLYYAKKWDKVDEYAQRLWTLVENKFI